MLKSTIAMADGLFHRLLLTQCRRRVSRVDVDQSVCLTVIDTGWDHNKLAAALGEPEDHVAKGKSRVVTG